MILIYYRRKFRSQTSDNMDRWKAETGRVREKRRVEERRSEKRKSQKKGAQMREKLGKSRNTVFFQWFVAPEGRKVGSLNRRVRSHLARWEMKKCTPLWREAHLQVKKLKAPHVRSTFGSWDVEKVHAVVARSMFRSQNAQSTPFSDHFWKLRCRKSARRCGAKHISKSECAKHTMLGPLLEVEMSKKCMPLWREAHFEVRMRKTHHARTTFGSWDVEKVHSVEARSTFWSQNVQNTPCSDHFWTFRCRFAWQAQGVVHLVQSQQNVRVLEHFQKNMAGVGHLQRICKVAFSVAGALQETSSSELLGGPGADFLRGDAFWSIRSSGLLRWFCVTGAALRLTWHHFFVAGAVV